MSDCRRFILHVSTRHFVSFWSVTTTWHWWHIHGGSVGSVRIMLGVGAAVVLGLVWLVPVFVPSPFPMKHTASRCPIRPQLLHALSLYRHSALRWLLLPQHPQGPTGDAFASGCPPTPLPPFPASLPLPPPLERPLICCLRFSRISSSFRSVRHGAILSYLLRRDGDLAHQKFKSLSAHTAPVPPFAVLKGSGTELKQDYVTN